MHRGTAGGSAEARAELRVYHTRIGGLRRLNRHMLRITLAGDDLAAFRPVGPDSFIYIFVPRRGTEARAAVGRDFTWDYWRTLPAPERPIGRYYTVRHHRDDATEIDIDVVVHGDGPGSTWATEQARPGQPLAFWGPRTAYAPPADTQSWLLVGDETGLPAISAILESLPPHASARAYIEVPDAEAELPLSSDARAEVTWLHRDGAEPGRSTLLVDSVRALQPPRERTYVWGGGEYLAMKDIREIATAAWRLDDARTSLVAYWRHTDHAD